MRVPLLRLSLRSTKLDTLEISRASQISELRDPSMGRSLELFCYVVY